MRGRTRTSTRVVGAIAAGTVVVLGFDLAVARTWGTSSALLYGRDIGIALIWTAVGVAAVWLRPTSRIGVIMLAFGAVLALNAPVGFGLRPATMPATAQLAAAVLLVPQPVLAAHAILAYPTGRLPDRAGRTLIRAGYAFAALDALRVVLTISDLGDATNCVGRCAANPLRVVDSARIEGALAAVSSAGWAILGTLMIGVLVRRVSRASPRERKVFAPALAAAFLAVLAFVVFAVTDGVGTANSTGPGGLRGELGSVLLQGCAAAAVPLAFLAGLLRERLACARVVDLLRALDRIPADQLGPAVAQALGDPSARIVFPRGNRDDLADGAGGADGAGYGADYIDAAGNKVAVPDRAGAQRVTPLGDTHPPVAVLVHDRHLDNEPALLAATGAAARLALDNARLHAKVHAQLAEVAESRARLVAAADGERRRLERDLHDGAQQSLVALGLFLQLLDRHLRDARPVVRHTLADAQVQLKNALHELRTLARGIRPAVLSDQGLTPALQQLASSSPLPVSVASELASRLPAPIEAAGYFVVSEALVNATKHACATAVTVRVSLVGDHVEVCVADDGIGGADPNAGSGLRGLAARVEEVGGRLDIVSPIGGGTRLVSHLPLQFDTRNGT
jgi:signal transduction histidine kinase